MLANISCDEYDNFFISHNLYLNFNQFSDLGVPLDLLEAKESLSTCVVCGM